MPTSEALPNSKKTFSVALAEVPSEEGGWRKQQMKLLQALDEGSTTARRFEGYDLPSKGARRSTQDRMILLQNLTNAERVKKMEQAVKTTSVLVDHINQRAVTPLLLFVDIKQVPRRNPSKTCYAERIQEVDGALEATRALGHVLYQQPVKHGTLLVPPIPRKFLSLHLADLTRMEAESTSRTAAKGLTLSAEKSKLGNLGVEGDTELKMEKCSGGLMSNHLSKLEEAGGAEGSILLRYQAELPSRYIRARPKEGKLEDPSVGTPTSAQNQGSNRVIWHNKKIQPSQIPIGVQMTEPTLALFHPRNKGSNIAECEAIKVVGCKPARDSGETAPKDLIRLLESGGSKGRGLPEPTQDLPSHSTTAPAIRP